MSRLLVVDDYELNRVALSRRLRRCGFEVAEAESGRKALDMVASEPFDLVLLDVMMPELDGISVLKALRENYNVNELPVIMVTAKDATRDVVEAFKLGANDYVVKPIDFDVALARIESLLARRAPGAAVRDDGLATLGPEDEAPPPQVEVECERIAGYRVTRKIGEGAMGEVWECVDERLDRAIAVKVLHPFLCADPGAADRFRREARAAARIEHPNVVGIYDAGEWDGRLYMAMQLIRGRSAQQLIEAHGALEPRRAASLVAQACRGLAAAHARGVVHRDVKPDNILIGDDVVKLTDFGLAKIVEPQPGAELRTRVGTLMGTPSYMSPEQVRAEAVDARSDIYSLGGTLYALLTGHRPYSELSGWIDIAQAHCRLPVPDPLSLRPDLPATLADVVRRAMAKSPPERFASAAEMAEALEQHDQ